MHYQRIQRTLTGQVRAGDGEEIPLAASGGLLVAAAGDDTGAVALRFDEERELMPLRTGRQFRRKFKRFHLVHGAGLVGDVDLLAFEAGMEIADGHGQPFNQPRVVIGADPAAGAEVVVTVPVGERWRLLQARAVLGTNAVVADRRGGWRIDDGAGNDVYVKRAPSVQPASTFAGYSLSPAGVVEPLTVDEMTLVLPVHFPLLSGWRLRTFTLNLQPGDDWGAPILVLEDYP